MCRRPFSHSYGRSLLLETGGGLRPGQVESGRPAAGGAGSAGAGGSAAGGAGGGPAAAQVQADDGPAARQPRPGHPARPPAQQSAGHRQRARRVPLAAAGNVSRPARHDGGRRCGPRGGRAGRAPGGRRSASGRREWTPAGSPSRTGPSTSSPCWKCWNTFPMRPAPSPKPSGSPAASSCCPSRPSADDNPQHIHLFSGPQLLALFAQAGAEHVNLSGVHNHLIAVARLPDPR